MGFLLYLAGFILFWTGFGGFGLIAIIIGMLLHWQFWLVFVLGGIFGFMFVRG